MEFGSLLLNKEMSKQNVWKPHQIRRVSLEALGQRGPARRGGGFGGEG